MARKKTRPAEDLFDIAAMLPWWVGVMVAIVAYVWLHGIAASEVTTTLQPGQAGQFAVQQMYKALAGAGQYFLPLIFLGGALASAFGRAKRRKLLVGVAENPAAGALEGMSWGEFERLVGEAFRLQGFAVSETGGGGADGGVDLVLTQGRETFLVQCKQWKAFKVRVGVVRELYGVMAAKGAVGGYVVTSGVFTADAKAFADGRNVELIDGERLRRMIQSVQSLESKAATPGGVNRAQPRPDESATPVCPKCGSAMVRRIARCGANAGADFWGCSQYPACKGTRTI